MSGLALAVPTENILKDIDNKLKDLSDVLKVASRRSRPIYLKQINKLLDERNTLTSNDD